MVLNKLERGLLGVENLAQTDVNNIYLIVGTLVVMNIGAIGTGLVVIIRLVWNAAKFHSRIEMLEKDVNAAHSKIRQLEDVDEV